MGSGHSWARPNFRIVRKPLKFILQNLSLFIWLDFENVKKSKFFRANVRIIEILAFGISLYEFVRIKRPNLLRKPMPNLRHRLNPSKVGKTRFAN